MYICTQGVSQAGWAGQVAGLSHNTQHSDAAQSQTFLLSVMTMLLILLAAALPARAIQQQQRKLSSQAQTTLSLSLPATHSGDLTVLASAKTTQAKSNNMAEQTF